MGRPRERDMVVIMGIRIHRACTYTKISCSLMSLEHVILTSEITIVFLILLEHIL